MKLRPGIPEFHNSLGVIYKDKRDWTAALNQAAPFLCRR